MFVGSFRVDVESHVQNSIRNSFEVVFWREARYSLFSHCNHGCFAKEVYEDIEAKGQHVVDWISTAEFALKPHDLRP